MAANTQQFRGSLYVDPSVMSVLVKSNLSKKASTASKRKCLADASQNGRAASEGTDSTAEPDFTDRSETDSLSGSFGCGRLSDGVSLHHIHQTQQLPRDDDVREANRASTKRSGGVAQKRSPNSGGKKGAGAFNDFGGAKNNHDAIESSPEAFAAAWNVAARAGTWKSDGRKTQSPKFQKEQLPQGPFVPHESFHHPPSSAATNATQRPRIEDLPMPKWFTSSCDNIVAPLPVGIVRKPQAERAVDQLAQIVQSALQQDQIKTQGHITQSASDQHLVNAIGRLLECAGPARAEDQGPRNGGSDQPLKIYTPYVEFNALGMNPDLPIKKRVPDWGF